jgi:5-methylcytosine-specific restriction endonuclease McrA
MNIYTPVAQTADLNRLGDEIAELSAHLDAATARLLDLIREFDARGGWANGFRSCAAWLSWRVGFSPGAAREHVRVARALGTLPRLAQALARGELSYVKVRELTRVATPETEARLLAVGCAGTAEHVERIVRGWRRMDRKAEAQEAARQHAGRALQVYQDEDGTVRIRGRLAPERYQVVVHVEATVLADPDQDGQSVLEDGARVPAGTSQRVACDASRVVMRHDADGRVMEVGARTRTIPPALRRALNHRDRGCRFPGCGVRFGQGHHIRHWAQGGPTTLSNLALLCRRHHRAVHEEGYQVERQSDGQLQFRRPNGWVIPDVPRSPELPEDPVAAIREQNERNGLALHARTAMPWWLGERLDVGYAIDVLHPLAVSGVAHR